MSGHYVSLTGSKSVTGLASVDPGRKEVAILLGRVATHGAINVQVELDGLAAALGYTGELQLNLWQMKPERTL